MACGSNQQRWRTDGKFFRAGSDRVRMRAVTYGPFPGGMPVALDDDFAKIAATGFNAIRLYEMPGVPLLNCAANHGLRVFGSLPWNQSADFFRQPRFFSAAVVALTEALRETRDHPALAGIYVGNEIPSDLVRWMGPLRVRRAIEELIDHGRAVAPDVMFAYSNYPSTEYLEPENADFTAFNVYLENEGAFRSYLKRLHHIAGDRPLVISEFGLDSRRNGLEKQAEILRWATQAALELEAAGMTIYAWSDRWWNGDAEVTDWDFGLNDRQGNAKPGLAAVQTPEPPPVSGELFFSVIVCSRNGASRIGACLEAIRRSHGSYKSYETIVVDDGSTDGTADFVETNFPWVRLIRLEPGGLSAARNAGAAAARGEVLAFTDDDCQPDREWIARLQPIFATDRYAAAGGPNLPPPPRNAEAAVVCAAPGAPSHVMLDDEEAEHLPGCNLVVRKSAFDAIGGFDPQFHTAGDDVDFCWRLRDAEFRLGFVPGAFVWHWRRPSIREFLRQQLGYGRAERLLLAKHPQRFSKAGDARWQGFVYGGGPVRVMKNSIIYFGSMGEAGYQAICNRMLPLRGLDPAFSTAKSRFVLGLVRFLQPRLRSWARNGGIFQSNRRQKMLRQRLSIEEFEVFSATGREREFYLNVLLRHAWKPGGATAPWDLESARGRVLIATERGKAGATNTLVRVWGRARHQVEGLLRKAERQAAGQDPLPSPPSRGE